MRSSFPSSCQNLFASLHLPCWTKYLDPSLGLIVLLTFLCWFYIVLCLFEDILCLCGHFVVIWGHFLFLCGHFISLWSFCVPEDILCCFVVVLHHFVSLCGQFVFFVLILSL